MKYIPGIGTTYSRWGRTQCPNNNTELVYSGKERKYNYKA